MFIGYKLIMESSKDYTERVIGVVANYYGISVEDILGHRRHYRMALARHVIAYILHLDGAGPSEIGGLLGRDHSTVLHGIKRVTRLIKEASMLDALIDIDEQLRRNDHENKDG